MNEVHPSEVKHDSSAYKAWWRCSKGHSWKTLIYVRSLGSNCPICWTGESKGENEVRSFLQGSFPDYHFDSTRSIISPKELDIYCPERKSAIEFNGLYWHSDSYLIENGLSGSMSQRHKEKVDMCRLKGIKLAYVWDIDWKNKPDEIKHDLINFIETGELSQNLVQLEKIKG